MSTTDNNNQPLSVDPQIDEDRVRRALGLKTTGSAQHTHQQRPEQARQRHKFITDGAVPVVMLNRSDVDTAGLRERITATENALEHERSAHASVKRALHDLQASHIALQTRLQHTEMAHSDALNSERQARRAAEESLAELRREQVVMPRRHRSAPVSVMPVEPVVAVEPDFEVSEERGVEAVGEEVSAEPVVAVLPVRRGRKPRLDAPVKEAKPVRWWTPSYRTKR